MLNEFLVTVGEITLLTWPIIVYLIVIVTLKVSAEILGRNMKNKVEEKING
jgi:hypothetical protein